MGVLRKSYPEDHWLKSHDPEAVLQAYLDQQDKAYSRVKNAFIRELLGDLKGKVVLDYGCGAGMFTVHAALRGARRVLCVDAEETALAAAKYFAAKEGVQNACEFIKSDRFPPLRVSGSVDVILMKDVIEHVPDDQALLDAASRALVPAGRLVLSTQNSLSLNYLLEGSYHRLLKGDKEWIGWDPTHLRFYTPMSLTRKLVSVGLRSRKWRSVYLIPYKLPAPRWLGKPFLRIDALSWFDRRLGAIFPYNRLGWNIVVRADASPLVSQRVTRRSPVAAVFPAEPALISRGSLRSEGEIS
ncbi:MAG: methyltransferase domain-containing protein [Desulfomonile tiedjei]|nr:methyltransferase domain-containing protein [Desulfomonile tiedjei]